MKRDVKLMAWLVMTPIGLFALVGILGVILGALTDKREIDRRLPLNEVARQQCYTLALTAYSIFNEQERDVRTVWPRLVKDQLRKKSEGWTVDAEQRLTDGHDIRFYSTVANQFFLIRAVDKNGNSMCEQVVFRTHEPGEFLGVAPR